MAIFFYIQELKGLIILLGGKRTGVAMVIATPVLYIVILQTIYLIIAKKDPLKLNILNLKKELFNRGRIYSLDDWNCFHKIKLRGCYYE